MNAVIPQVQPLPTLITVQEFAKVMHVTRAVAYAIVDNMPPGVKVKFGGRVRVNQDRLREWIEAGADFQAGGAK